VNRGAKGDTVRKLCDTVQRERPRWLRSLPRVFPPHFFTSSDTRLDDDSAVDNGAHACRYTCAYNAFDNGVTRVGDDPQLLRHRKPSFSPPSRVSALPISASDPTAFAV
jgi:hypothetical protein